jgi:hypothetical protein
MGTPAEFIQNAHDCISLAKRTTNAVHQRLLVNLAVKWLQLAGMTRREIETVMNPSKQSAA